MTLDETIEWFENVIINVQPEAKPKWESVLHYLKEFKKIKQYENK